MVLTTACRLKEAGGSKERCSWSKVDSWWVMGPVRIVREWETRYSNLRVERSQVLSVKGAARIY